MNVFIGDNAVQKIEELNSKSIPVYSISRLGQFEHCPYSYKLRYINSIKGIDNIYSSLGSLVHKMLEDKFIKTKNNEDISINPKKEIEKCINDSELQGSFFPSEKSKNKWIKDMVHFYNNSDYYKKDITLNELQFLLEIDGIYIQGFIDAILKDEDSYSIIDWKTSSKFSKSDLESKGRQLVLYKMAFEATGKKVTNAYWNMLKYAIVTWNQNGKLKNKICERCEIVESMKIYIDKELKENNVSEFDASFMYIEAQTKNDFSAFPKYISDNYKISDYYLEYEINDLVIMELKSYIKSMSSQIEQNYNNNTFWKPIPVDKNSSFFCNTLCGNRANCQYIEEYNIKMKQEHVFDVIDDIFA